MGNSKTHKNLAIEVLEPGSLVIDSAAEKDRDFCFKIFMLVQKNSFDVITINLFNRVNLIYSLLEVRLIFSKYNQYKTVKIKCCA